MPQYPYRMEGQSTSASASLKISGETSLASAVDYRTIGGAHLIGTFVDDGMFCGERFVNLYTPAGPFTNPCVAILHFKTALKNVSDERRVLEMLVNSEI